MADRFPAQIWIGGQLSRTARLYPKDDQDDTTILQGLIGALNEDDASHEFGDTCIPANCPEADLGNYLSDDGKLLHLRQGQAVNGEFPETEQFCMDHGIPFDRWSAHGGDCDAENVGWRPGMNNRVVNYADSCGDEIVDGETVRLAIAEFEACKQPVPHTMKTPRFEAGLQLLHDACPELPPDLEVFNLHDD